MAESKENPNRRLNILYFGPRGLSGGLGGSARLRNMLDVLRKLPASTRLVSYLPEKRFAVSHQKVNDSLAATVISVPTRAPKVLKLPALKLVFYYGLRYAGKSDVILAHSPGTVYGFPALVMARLFHKPLLIDLTDSRDPDTPAWLYRFVLRHASVTFAVSRYLAEVARAAGCRNVVHAPGFINTEAFEFDAAARTRIRKELNFGEKDIVLGYAGAFSPDEGLSYLLEAVRQLAAKYPNLKLVLLGGRNTPGTDDISGLIRELGLTGRVIHIPPQPYETVPGYLSAFDIGCSPKADREVNRAADPIRVYEYMAVGLPVVATAVGETANTIENGADGFLARPEDAEDMARVLESVIKNLDSLSELKKKAREKVVRGYSQEAMQARLTASLSTLVTKKP